MGAYLKNETMFVLSSNDLENKGALILSLEGMAKGAKFV